MKLEPYQSEEDVRAKYICPFLERCGFTDDDYFLERTIKIQLGKNKNTISMSGRYDVLVKSPTSGKNLIIFELKSPSEKIDGKVVDQAVSYARLLEGNIAPYVALCNGSDVFIYCSITKKKVNKITKEEIQIEKEYKLQELRNEANDYLNKNKTKEIVTNLINKITKDELSILSGDFDDGKKYNKKIYVDLNEKEIDWEYSDLFIVTGQPQSGKTNYLCHKAKESINKNKNTIFLRATSIKFGLLKYITDKLNLTLRSNSNTEKILLEKVINSQLHVYIDGLNEIDKVDRDLLLNDLYTLHCKGAKIAFSITEHLLNETIKDYKNDRINLFNNFNNKECIIKISLDEDKLIKLKNSYNKYYHQKKEPNFKISTPFTLRNYYDISNDIEDINTEFKLNKFSLKDICKRVSNKEGLNIELILKDFAFSLANNTKSLKETSFMEKFYNKPYSFIPDYYISNGLLESNNGYIDFYFEAYRDILIISEIIDESSNITDIISKILNLRNERISSSCLIKYVTNYNITADKIKRENIDLERTLEALIKSNIYSESITSKNLNGILEIQELICKTDNSENLEYSFELLLDSIGNIEDPENINSNLLYKLLGMYLAISNNDNHYLLHASFIKKIEFNNYEDNIYTKISEIVMNLDYYDELSFLEVDFCKIIKNKLYSSNDINTFKNFTRSNINYILFYQPIMCSAPCYIDQLITDYGYDNSNEILSYIADKLKHISILFDDEYIFSDELSLILEKIEKN